MSAVTVKAPTVGTRSGVGVWRIAQSAAVVSVGLYALAFLVRIWAIGLISFPLTESSAYYAAVARNLATGRGLLIDAIWSYSTPPLTLPRPAFELWQPLASFVAAAPMALFGSTFDVAQFAGLLLGSLLAPMAWLVARDTARRLKLPERRAWFVSVGAGVLAAVTGPFLLSTAVPDSALTFTVLAVGGCLLMPAAANGERRALIGLGILLGLTYLTRFEAIWLGLTFAGLVLVSRRALGLALRPAFLRIAAVAAIAAVVAVPWWLRNLSVFGSPFPGQVADNVFLTRNEQIYAYLDRPSLDGFLGQGIPQMLVNVGFAFWHNFVDVLLVPAAPVVAVGLIAIGAAIWQRRQLPGAVRVGTLAVLLVSGALTYVATGVLFPVATLWGTFEHASGPLLVGLIVAAVLGGDAFVAWLVQRRDWERQNGWMAPAALIALTVPLALFQMSSAAREARVDQGTMAQLAGEVPAALNAAGVDEQAPIMTDRPIWLSDALGRSTLALSDEPVETVLEVARRFGAGAVVVVEGRGDYPAALVNGQSSCFQPLTSTNSEGTATVFVINQECVR
jgi:4-amino-4-deoxy-L-arabinose transferase-like glycosyltransferase